MAFCANCTDPIAGTPQYEPFGRDGAMVALCRDCATGDLRDGRYAFGGGRGTVPTYSCVTRQHGNRRGGAK